MAQHKKLTEMKNLIFSLVELTDKIRGGCFANLVDYTNNNGEVANHRINLGMNYGQAKADDYNTIKSAVASQVAKLVGFPLPMVMDTLIKIENSLNPKEEQTKRGKAQSDAYIKINGCVKYHTEKKAYYIYAYRVSKVVTVEGTYTGEQSEEARCRKAVEKALNLKTAKYGNFKLTEDKFTGGKILGEELYF